jgi:hypothetical protein
MSRDMSRHTRDRFALALPILLALGVLLAACGIPEDDQTRAISADAVPDQLSTGREIVTTSTTAPGSIFNETYYLIRTSLQSDVLVPVEVSIPPEVLRDRRAIPRYVLDQLIDASSDTFIPPDTEIVRLDVGTDGIMVLDLNSAIRDTIQSGDQRRAFAQILFTAIGIESGPVPISGVRFLIEGEPAEVPAETGAVPPGQAVTESNFPEMADQVREAPTN